MEKTYYIVISKEHMGYDISIYDETGTLVIKNWKSDIGYARQCASIWADAYSATIHYNC